jgi:HSP20 family protein
MYHLITNYGGIMLKQKSKTIKILISALPLVFSSAAFAGDSVKIDTQPNNNNDILSIHQMMQQKIQNMMSGFATQPAFFGLNQNDNFSTKYPNADVSEKKDNVEVKIDLPGVDKKNVDVLVFEDNVTLKVTKENKKEENSQNYFISERQNGVFQRVIPLPSLVNQEKAESEFKDGVLTITIPKLENQKPKYKKLDL